MASPSIPEMVEAVQSDARITLNERVALPLVPEEGNTLRLLEKELTQSQNNFLRSELRLRLTEAEIKQLKVVLEIMNGRKKKLFSWEILQRRVIPSRQSLLAKIERIHQIQTAMEQAFKEVLEQECAHSSTRHQMLEQALARSHEANRDAQEKISILTASNALLHAANENLKLTSQQLIALLEGLHAAGVPIDVDDAFARLNRKYKTLKGKYKILKAVL
ncbi:hypothetical protein C8R45DRAFT_948454 [Mycena sanguinolenta]|nr:hypothetical protein C8R45DRAFT_948454 [Mycena sanguinolenta]